MYNNYYGKHKKLINLLIAIVKQYIYLTKCKHENHTFIGLVNKMRYWYLIDKQIAFEANKLSHFAKKMESCFLILLLYITVCMHNVMHNLREIYDRHAIHGY